MATYSTIKGFTIQSLASDPYTTAVASGTWASGNALNTARLGLSGSINGTQNAFLVFGGGTPGASDLTEEYDGTSWTEKADLQAAVNYGAGAGISTAALMVGGEAPGRTAKTESWNGTSWTEVNDLNTAKSLFGGVMGTTSSAQAVGGQTPAVPTVGTQNETWDGTCWTETTDSSISRYAGVGIGSSNTDSMVTGGQSPPTPNVASTEKWDGTSWTEVADLNTGRKYLAGSGPSTTSALVFGGGTPGLVANTESFDGTTWTERDDLATATQSLTGGGTTSAGLSAGGQTPSLTDATEEWATADPLTLAQEGQVWYNTTSNVLKGFGQFLTTGTWSSGGGMAAYANGIKGFGTQTATIGAGYSTVSLSYTYDGSAWSSINGLVNAPGRYYPGGTGTTTAGIIFGGEPGKNNSELWDGTSWSEENNLTTGRTYIASGGTSTAAFGAGGYAPGYSVKTEEYDGTSWTEGGDLSTGVQGPGGNGSTTAAIIWSGKSAPTTVVATSLTYNGTAWTEGAAVNTACSMMGSAGPQTGNGAALKFGGDTQPGKTVNTELYDGSTWTEVGNIANSRRSYGAAGTTASAVFFGGEPPSGNGLTEEWSVAPAIKTFTSS